MEIESALSATLESVEPWVLQSNDDKETNHNRPRVRPIPTTLTHSSTGTGSNHASSHISKVQQLEQPSTLSSTSALAILHVARSLANRTSAPAGWNPAAPVVGFSTPSPLPHQLRGGALASLQLERAQKRLAETQLLRKKQARIEKQQEQLNKEKSQEETNDSNPNESIKPATTQPKKSSNAPASTTSASKLQQPHQQRPNRSKEQVSMNLSDSSDEEESDDEP